MKKRLISLLVCTVLVLSLFPFSAFADDPVLLHVGSDDLTESQLASDQTGESWSWNARTRVLTISGMQSGGYIRAEEAFGDLTVESLERAKFDLTADVAQCCIGVYGGSLHFSQHSDYEATFKNPDNGKWSIYANGDVYLNAESSISVDDGICADNVIFSGDSNIYVNCSDSVAVRAYGDVRRTGTGNLRISGAQGGVLFLNDGSQLLIDSEMCRVEINSKSSSYPAIVQPSPGSAEVVLTYPDKFTVSGTPDSQSVIYDNQKTLKVGGKWFGSKDVQSTLKGDGWNWSASSYELSLKNYNGGSIIFDDESHNLCVITVAGTENVITYGNDGDHSGIFAQGGLTLRGSGDIEFCGGGSNIKAYDGIALQMDGDLIGDGELYAGESLYVSGSGDIKTRSLFGWRYVVIDGSGNIDLFADTDAILAYQRDLEITGSRNITVRSDMRCLAAYNGKVTVSGSVNLTTYGSSSGIESEEDLEISTSGDVTIVQSEWNGIEVGEGDVIFSGSGNVYISGAQNGISLEETGKTVRLNGTGSVVISAGEGYAAVNNTVDSSSPVEGTNLSSYHLAGSPSSVFASYTRGTSALHIEGSDYTSAQLANNMTGSGWSWNAAAQEITLFGYNGGSITADGPLTVNVNPGTENKISADAGKNALGTLSGGIYLRGEGSLAVTSDGALPAVSAQNCGIFKDMSGDFTVTLSAGSASCAVESGGPVSLNGGGKVTVTSSADAIHSEGGILLDGEGEVTLNAAKQGVVLTSSPAAVFINGLPDRVTLSAGSGYKAVYNVVTSESPVRGEKLSRFKLTGDPASPSAVYDIIGLTVNGVGLAVVDMLSDQSGDGWNWSSSTRELTLKNYNGTSIIAEEIHGDLVIVLASGSKNVIASEDWYCLRSAKTLTIKGSGDLTVMPLKDCGNIIRSEDLTVEMSGDLTVTASAKLSVNESIFCNSAVFSGSGDVTVDEASWQGIWAKSDVTFSGSGRIDISGWDQAVYISSEGCLLHIDGHNPLIRLAGAGSKAVDTKDHAPEPVVGSSLAEYEVTGAPDSPEVIYKLDHVPGDVNEDGKVNAKDASVFMKYLAGWSVTMTEANADVNGDGVYNAKDVSLILKFIAGWDVVLG